MVKNLPAKWETQVQPLGLEDPLEKGMATHSSILAHGEFHGQSNNKLKKKKKVNLHIMKANQKERNQICLKKKHD